MAYFMKDDLKALLSLIAIIFIFAVIIAMVSTIEGQKINLAGNAVLDSKTGKLYSFRLHPAPHISQYTDAVQGSRSTRILWAEPSVRKLVQCKDFDNGRDFEKASYAASSGGVYFRDHCEDMDLLQEAVCGLKYGSGNYVEHYCSSDGMVCVRGRCISR